MTVVLLDLKAFVDREAGVADVVVDPQGEIRPRLRRLQFVERGLGHRRREFLRRQAVTPADDVRHRRALAAGDGAGEAGHDVLEQRFARAARLFGAVQNRDPADLLGQRGQQMRDRERPEQAHLQHAHLLAGSPQSGRRRARRFGSRAHEDQNPVGVRGAFILEQSILPAGPRGEALHGAFDDLGHALMVRIDRLARLEERVRVLRRAADERMLRVQPARAMSAHQIVVDHRANVGVAEQIQRVQLMRGAEAVEEMQERHARFQRRHLRDQRAIVRLLHRRGTQQRKPRGPSGHHVRMIAEDRQRRRRQRARGDMKDGRVQLPGDLEHVRQHQHQALRRRERRGQRARLQSAVERAGGAAFGLHFLHDRHIAPNVLNPGGRPFVGDVGHRRRRGDREDRADLVDPIGDMRDGGVAVHRGARAHRTAPSARGVDREGNGARDIGDHLHRVARALFDAHGASGAQIHVDAVSMSRTEPDDRRLRARGETIVAFEAIAAGQASLRFVARRRRVESAHDFVKSVDPFRGFVGPLRTRIGVAVDRRTQHLEGHDRRLRRRLVVRAAQPGVDIPRRAFAVADGDRHRPFAGDRVAAGEQPGVTGHHVDADDNCAVGAERQSRHIAQEAALRRLAERQHHGVGRQRFELSRRLRMTVGVERRRLDGEFGPDDLLDGREPLDLDALLDRFVGLEGVRRHVGPVAPVDDQGLVGAQTPRRPRRIHRRIAAAINDHPAAQKRGLARADVMQQRNRVEDPHGVARRNLDMLAHIRADREEGGVEPPCRDFGQDVFNLVIEDDLHSGGLDPANFALEIFSGQAVGGNAELHHAAGY